MYSGEPARRHHDASARVTVACRIALDGGLRDLKRGENQNDKRAVEIHLTKRAADRLPPK